MSRERIIWPIEQDIVEQLLADIPYLSPARGGTCRAVADVATYMNLAAQFNPPAVLVKYGGETTSRGSPGSGRNIGSPAQVVGHSKWILGCIAQSFTPEGEGRGDVHWRDGLYSLLEDVFYALEGYRLPHGPNNAKTFWYGNSDPRLEGHRVVSESYFYADVLRLGVQ